MALSSTLSIPLPINLSYCGCEWKLLFLRPARKKIRYLCMNGLRVSDNGAIEPARMHLERLFVQTQKLEEQIRRDPRSADASELILNLDSLESGLRVVFSSLKQKEEDLQDAEKRMLLEYDEISNVRMDLERREEEIVSSWREQKKLENELRQANEDLASQAAEISVSQVALSDKEEEVVKLKLELAKMNEEASNADLELGSRARLLDEANKIVKKQEDELLQFKFALEKKEEELHNSVHLQRSDSEKLDVAEKNLRKQTENWLLAQAELKRQSEEARKSSEEFQTVKMLLEDMRSELVLSQKDLASSRQKLEAQNHILEKQLMELSEQRGSVMSYMINLRDALLELENERAKLDAAEAQNELLENKLNFEKELVCSLQKELNEERMSLKLATKKISDIQAEIDQKSVAFEQKQVLLKCKEAELVEVKVEVKQLKCGQASLQRMLEEKDEELSNANEILGKLNKEIIELKEMFSKTENELILAVCALKVKNEHVQTLQHQISNANLKFAEAETVIYKILDLTKSGSNDHNVVQLESPLQNSLADSFTRQKLEVVSELEFTKQVLKSKEMEVIKAENELKMVREKLHAKEEEITKMREYAFSQERIGEIATEKLQLEATKLESRSALYKGGSCTKKGFEQNEECSQQIRPEVCRLLKLTEKLVMEAGITTV